MSIVSLKIKFSLCVMALSAPAIAASLFDTPKVVRLSGDAELQRIDHKLTEFDAVHHRRISVRFLGPQGGSLIPKYAGIDFPEDRSIVIDGKEYVLLVVRQVSRMSLRGQCGSGEEGTLYVLQIKNGAIAIPRYSLLVQSCWNNMELVGNRDGTPYLSIKWIDNPAGFKVEWEYVGDSGPLIRTYRYSNGTFVEETEK